MILLKNTQNRFGLIAILIHWLMAFMLIFMVTLGLYMVRLPVSVQKLKFFGWHKEWGIVVFMLVIVRLMWRWFNSLPSLHQLPRWERVSARGVHIAFYIFMVLIPVSGWLITSFAGLPVSFFGWFLLPNLGAPNPALQLFFEQVHQWLAYALIFAFCLHVGAALKHYFINKDDIMQRMLKP